jgi:hypothetical protein
VEAGSAALRVDRPVYPRRAEHNTVAEGGIEDERRLPVRTRPCRRPAGFALQGGTRRCALGHRGGRTKKGDSDCRPLVSVMIWSPYAAAACRAQASMAITAICRYRSSWRGRRAAEVRGPEHAPGGQAQLPAIRAVAHEWRESLSDSRVECRAGLACRGGQHRASEAKANATRPLELGLLDTSGRRLNRPIYRTFAVATRNLTNCGWAKLCAGNRERTTRK